MNIRLMILTTYYLETPLRSIYKRDNKLDVMSSFMHFFPANQGVAFVSYSVTEVQK